ncbi:MAG: hypothetical protein WCT02_02260 [Candidatus Paceibacterota bacterium]
MKKIIASLVVLAPSIVLAQANLNAITDVNSLSKRLFGIGNVVLYGLVALAVIFIVYNVVMYVIKPPSSEEKTAAGLNILWGIVGLFIIVSIWGLVNILVGTFGTTPTNAPIPNIGNNNNNGGFPANQLPTVTN